MPPPPIHRSKTLWLGILTLTFLAWAWHDSTHWNTTLRFWKYAIKHAGSGISLARYTATPAKHIWARHPVLRDDHQWSRPHVDAPELFRCTDDPKQLYHYYTKQPGSTTYLPRNSAALHFSPLMDPGTRSIVHSRAIYLPHWLLILCFLIPWLALLLWSHHRINQLHRQGPLSERSGE